MSDTLCDEAHKPWTPVKWKYCQLVKIQAHDKTS